MILLIANDGPLGPEWLDHALAGAWAAHRECHIGGDFLLIYRLDGKALNEVIAFVRTGTHADLSSIHPTYGALLMGMSIWPQWSSRRRRHPRRLPLLGHAAYERTVF